MESDEIEYSSRFADTADVAVDCQSAVNSLILDYYKKFGRKRDLEQYFSLSTAQGDLRDPSGLFWRNMKDENESSGSEGRRSVSAEEVCRISIRCSVPDPCSSQDENTHTKTESDSPPIIIEEIAVDTSRHTDEESSKSDDNNSQRSYDVMLDTSALKRLSPTSSITSQRKLEWDSLADVGYANESDRKNSASSLSTLERLALMQQYSNNDTKQDIGPPTSHSTPLEGNDKGKNTKGLVKKTTKFHKKDVEFVEVNVPHSSHNNPTQSINVNLTKHISFNVERDGGVTIDSIKKDINVSPEKNSGQDVSPQIRFDKEIQTSLTKTKDKSITPVSSPKAVNLDSQKIPVMISLNTLRKRMRRKKSKGLRRRLRPKKVCKDESLPQEKSEQLSEAESFEYMPGHIYNQNLKSNEDRPANTSAGNKSSLESSAGMTDSSKGSRHSFTKDLEKSIELLKDTLQKRYNDSDVKNKLIKELVSRLLRSKYRDDDSAGEFLSGLTFSSRRIGLRDNHTTTSTSDTNNTEDSKSKIAKKSILRPEKFNPNIVASTSQSAPNLLSVASSEKIPSNLVKVTRNTDSDVSSRKSSSDNAFPKTSSEELYLKYLEALRREKAYKKHLKDKEMFLKQKLVSSDTVFKVPVHQEVVINDRLKDLMKDLTRNNYDDGSGDASKLEGGSNSVDFERYNAVRNHKSHSVFTLSSSHSECQGKKPNLKKKQCDIKDLNEAGPSKHYCCCPQHYTKSKVGYADSSVQVNIKCQYDDTECAEKPKSSALECHKCTESPRNMGRMISDDTGDIKYVCLCNEKPSAARNMGDNFLLYKCSRLTDRGVQLEGISSKISNTGVQCGGADSCSKHKDDIELIRPPRQMTDNESSSSDNIPCVRKQSKSSQTNLLVKMIYQDPSGTMSCISDGKTSKGDPSMSTKCVAGSASSKDIVHEATRCLQTEISINPKISDPSLTDINLVNDCECAKLVEEKFREVSKKSESGLSAKGCSDICASSGSGKNSVKNQDFDDEEKRSDGLKEFKEPSNAFAKMVRDDYQIPIHGTNMTLKVTLGTLEVKEKVEKVNQACVTDKACIVEQATSIRDECSKSVQCECTQIATTKQTGRLRVDNKVNKDTSTQSGGCEVEQPIKAGVPEQPKSNTYPKHVPIKKPFLRTNTDTGSMEKSCCVQTDFATQTNNGTKRVPHVDQTGPTITYDSDNSNRRKSNIENGVANKSPRSESCPESGGKKDIGIQKDLPAQPKETKPPSPTKTSKCVGYEIENERYATKEKIENESNGGKKKTQTPFSKSKESPKCSSDSERTYKSVCSDDPKASSASKVHDKSGKDDTDVDSIKDPILDMIKDITKRYSKNDIEKMKRKTCFKEIMTVLNYLLETDESSERDKPSSGSGADTKSSCNTKTAQEKGPEDYSVPKPTEKPPRVTKTCKTIKVSTESSDIPASSDLPATSSDSATCKVLNKIKKECEKYHQKRCKAGKKCEASSSTSLNCDQCRKVHHCGCRSHKCKRSKTSVEKFQKKCVAYNLIIQTSESMISEETACDNKCRPLQNIVVKVPKRKLGENVCKDTSCKKETVYKVEKPRCSPRCAKNRSRSCPNESEMSSTEEFLKKTQQCTVREYLEKNRPDFVENCSQRQNCLKLVSDIRADERAAQRDLLSMYVARQSTLTTLSASHLRRLAADIGIDLRRRNPAPKFMSEKEMKKHSQKIYKTLPEVVQKKEEKKKENIKKTNLLMANIFNKNLQKKTLRGSVNLSNYSAVIKI